MANVDEILSRLDRLGYRDTGPRRAIIEAICAREGAFSAQEIADELAVRRIGRATVFRAVAVLQELGYLSRLHVGEDCHRYALCDRTHHHHLVCTSCGQVFPFEHCSIEQQAAEAARQHNFAVRGHHVDVFGECASCAAG